MERQYIPAAFHSELTEYVALLRSLRINNTLDVSLHLARHGRVDSSSSDSVSDDDEDLDGRTSPTFAEAVMGAKRKRRHSIGPTRKRDNWTRWPLLLTDLHKPAWTFEDEVATVASQAQKIFPPPFSSPTESSSPCSENEYSGVTSLEDYDNEQEDDADDPDEPSYCKFIGMSASTLLSNILALLSSHTPPRPPSMQNRIEPIDWHSVLEVASVYGDTNVVDEQLINKVKTRMETLYDLLPASSLPGAEGENLIAYRLRKNVEAKLRLESTMSLAHDSLFTITEPPPNFFTRPRALNTTKWKKAKNKTKNKGPEKIKPAKSVSSDDESEERPLAMMVKERREVKVRKVKPQPIKKAKMKNRATPKIKSAEFISSSDESEETALRASFFSMGNISESESQSGGEPSTQMRHTLSRRAKSNMSYTAPNYFFDKDVMG
ncbi:hypothetical protein AX15_000232 [Amanita polypyramis BW_CC]|nr:hypothetical protein AX15_000232 [Amanita polypyramis BW_CC]